MVPTRAPLAALFLSLAFTASSAPTLDDAAKSLGIGAESVAELKAGKVVTKELEPAAPTELGVALAVLVRKPLEATKAFMASDAFFEQDRQVLAHGEIDPAHPELALAKAGFSAQETPEIKKLLASAPGDTVNLSAAEATRLQGLGLDPKDATSREPATAAYRELLAARVAAYRDAGLDGCAPYQRGGGKTTDLASRLRASQKASGVLKERAPDLDAALSGGSPDGMTQRWLWLKQVAQDRPVFVLSHRIRTDMPGAVFAAERQYFVGHSWDCGLILGGLVETTEGTLLVYMNRIHVDAVAGAMGGMKRNIGRGMQEKSIRGLFEQVKRSAEAR